MWSLSNLLPKVECVTLEPHDVAPNTVRRWPVTTVPWTGSIPDMRSYLQDSGRIGLISNVQRLYDWIRTAWGKGVRVSCLLSAQNYDTELEEFEGLGLPINFVRCD